MTPPAVSKRLAGTLAICLILLMSAACRRRAIERPNVLIIVLDTVRYDRLSTFGYSLPTSPNLDRLAEESTIFTNAYSTSSWTAPAHASLFTGLYPAAHGVTQERWHMSEELVTLAEVLQKEGYYTFGLVENASLSRRNGFSQGFSTYVPLWRHRRENGTHTEEAGELSSETILAFEETLAAWDGSQPFLGFVNLVGAHSRYRSSDSHKALFVTDPTITVDGNMWSSYYRGETQFKPQEVRHLNELYDASILAVDETVQALVDALQRQNLLDETLLVITSDHGENLGDHDHFGHVFSLYNSTFKVPLLIRFPGIFDAGAVWREPVQLTDVAPTVLEILGVDAAALAVQGKSLLSAHRQRQRVVFGEYYRPRQAVRAMQRRTREDVWSTIERFDRHLRTVIDRDMKLIWASDGRNELYDLALDPAENENLINDPDYAGEKERLEQLLEKIMEFTSRHMEQDPKWDNESLDDETIDALKALGYLN